MQKSKTPRARYCQTLICATGQVRGAGQLTPLHCSAGVPTSHEAYLVHCLDAKAIGLIRWTSRQHHSPAGTALWKLKRRLASMSNTETALSDWSAGNTFCWSSWTQPCPHNQLALRLSSQPCAALHSRHHRYFPGPRFPSGDRAPDFRRSRIVSLSVHRKRLSLPHHRQTCHSPVSMAHQTFSVHLYFTLNGMFGIQVTDYLTHGICRAPGARHSWLWCLLGATAINGCPRLKF